MLNLVIIQLCANAKNFLLFDEHMDHFFNCHLFTTEVKDRHDAIVHEVHSLSQHAAKSFSFPKCDDLRTPDGLIRGLNIKPLYLDVTIANPTSITYFGRGSSREEHVAIKDKEKLNILSGARRLILILCLWLLKKFEDFLKEMVKTASEMNRFPYSVLLNFSDF